ncbi:hypothetical protein [Halobacterium litoreum]|uniref:SPW repeat-containing protein n=1 Tax=Halobacterium litoreum TaxID=2039234 RepID=A0ABD5NF65_9EURY|nr:hypothetical protein [Halobacterium litoreum]UHH13256.1 hypothetical protein LT972_13995 [Halobacterium litoreum]
MSSNDYTTGELTAVGGATLAAISAFLPWITVSFGGVSGSQKGMDVAATLDGRIVLLLAILAVGVVVLREWERADAGAVAAFGLVTTGIGAMYLLDPAAAANASGSFGASLIQSGYGLYAAVVGGLVMLGGGAIGLAD